MVNTGPGFYMSAGEILKTLWEKEKLLTSAFYLSEELSATLVKYEIAVCKLFSVWRSLKNLSIRKGLKTAIKCFIAVRLHLLDDKTLTLSMSIYLLYQMIEFVFAIVEEIV